MLIVVWFQCIHGFGYVLIFFVTLSFWLHRLFFIRTSNFGAEAERSHIFFLRFEAKNVLKMFLNYMVYTRCISVSQCRKPIKVHCLLSYGIKNCWLWQTEMCVTIVNAIQLKHALNMAFHFVDKSCVFEPNTLQKLSDFLRGKRCESELETLQGECLIDNYMLRI